MAGTEDIPGVDKSSPNYSFSGSATGFSSDFRQQPPITSSVDNLGFFLPRGTPNSLGSSTSPEQYGIDSYRITTLPAKNIGVHISSSFNFKTDDFEVTTTSLTASIRILTNPLTVGTVPPSPNVLAKSTITQSAGDFDGTNMVYTGSFEIFTTISASQYTPGDCLYFDLNLEAYGPDPSAHPIATFVNGNFQNLIWEISSSAAVVNPLDMSFEPYFTSPFYGTDCDVMYGDISQGVENNFLQDVDYSTDMLIPVNYLAIQNDTATRATVPESYYTSLAQTNIRYNGSINQSEKINQWTEETKLTDFSQSFNIGTYGKTSPIDSNKVLICEFEWGGGTTPEILDWGGFKMGPILQVNSPENTKIINPGDNLTTKIYRKPWDDFSGDPIYYTASRGDYYLTLNSNFQYNDQILPFTYKSSTQATLPDTAQIISTEWGVPSISNFIITSSNTTGDEKGTGASGYLGRIERNTNYIDFYVSQSDGGAKLFAPTFNYVKRENGVYQSGAPIRAYLDNQSTNPIGDNIVNVVTIIQRDIQLNGFSDKKDNRWFITLYEELDTPINNSSLVPFNHKKEGLRSKGVYEITSINEDMDSVGPERYWTRWFLSENFGQLDVANSQYKYIGSNSSGTVPGLGCLIWKANTDTPNVIVNHLVTGGVENGFFLHQFTPNYIINNKEQITKEFGSNTI